VIKIAAIAAVTVRDALRQKLAVNLLVFALLVISVSVVVSQLTFGEQYRIISDLALSSAAIFGTLIAVFIGAGLVAGDIQRRTLYPIIAKPVSRTEYLLGRYMGLLITLTLNLLVMTLTTVAVIWFYRGSPAFLVTSPILLAFLTLAAQLAMVGAIALLFSSFTSTTLAAICTLAVAVAGHLSRDAIPYWRASTVGRVAALLIPNLAALDYKVAVVYEDALRGGEVALRLGYAALYVGTALALASAIFSRRDLR
jgi:ABC-type transport system involved in multi-copper enzyme maturation permease subunit